MADKQVDGAEAVGVPLSPDFVFRESQRLREEMDDALANGDNDRAAELSVERQNLKAAAEVAAFSSERAWDELISIRRTIANRKTGRSWGWFSRFLDSSDDDRETGANPIQNHELPESEFFLQDRERELIDLLHQAGECDKEGNPIKRNAQWPDQ